MLGWVMDPLLRFDFALCERKSWVGWVALLATTNILSTQSHFFNSRPKMPEARMDEWALWYEAFQEAKAKGAPKSVKGLEVWFFEIFVKIGYGRLDWWIGSFTTCSWSLLLLFFAPCLAPAISDEWQLLDDAMWFCACVCSYSLPVLEAEEHFSLQITRMNGIPLAKHLAQQGCVCWKQIGRMIRRQKV